MKKLLIVAAATLLGCAVNAATILWDNGNGDLFDYASGGVANGFATYFFDTASVDLATATDYANNGKFADLAALGVEGYAADGGWVEGEATDFLAGSDVSAYLVAFNASDVASATAAYISDVASIHMPGSGVDASYSFNLSSSADAGNWATSDVPEPTSGILLVLGMAGLALRRRNA